MQNIIERIGHFADIDTRRAMGFKPRKLPPSNIVLPERIFGWGNVKIKFDRCIKLVVFHYQGAFSWSFNCNGHTWNQRSFVFEKGHIKSWVGWDRRESWHPDFNEDGSFKRAKAFLP